MTLVIVLGILLALALMQLRWLMFPPAPNLVAEIDEWRRARELVTQRRAESSQPLSPLGRLTRWIVEALRSYRPQFLDTLAPDLAITQRELHSWASRVVGLALAFGLAPVLLMGARRAGGNDVSVQWAPVIGLVLGGAAVALSIKDLRDAATQEREQFVRGISLYLDLVAMSMEAGQGHAQALPAASRIGTGRVFAEIQNAIGLAPSKGISTWEALGQLGERYRIPELISLRASIELAQDDGARVKASLIARADTMRSSRLAAAVERADNATESMRQMTLIAAILAGVYIAAPYILALRTAAGAG